MVAARSGRRRRLSHVAVAMVAATALAVAVGPSATSAAPPEPSFSGPVNYPAGVTPQAVVVGDLNGDGYLDLAVANAESDSVSLLLGGGNGTFKPPASLSVGLGTEPRALAVGDLNGDRYPDLVAVGSVFEFNNVAVLLGGAGGAFTGPTYFDSGEAPVSVAVGDFNRDGNNDLAVVNANFVTVSVLLGVGDGTFSEPTDFDSGSGPFAVVVEDFNGDGNPDLAIANGGVDTVSVLLGTGDGSFSAPTGFPAGIEPRALALGDFNGDGDPDLAVANDTGSSTSSNTVSVLLGGPGGSFTGPTMYPAGLTPLGVAVGDFNGDFNADLAVANANSNDVSVLIGLRDGSFAAPTNYPAGAFPKAVAAGDFNGDGASDLALANEDSANVSVLLAEVAPSSSGDFYRTARATALRVAAPGVLGNDADPNGDPLTAALDAAPLHGTVVLDADGSFSYDPDPAFAGTDTFTYRASDDNIGGVSDVATVTITVDDTGQPPPTTTATTIPPTRATTSGGGGRGTLPATGGEAPTLVLLALLLLAGGSVAVAMAARRRPSTDDR